MSGLMDWALKFELSPIADFGYFVWNEVVNPNGPKNRLGGPFELG